MTVKDFLRELVIESHDQKVVLVCQKRNEDTGKAMGQIRTLSEIENFIRCEVGSTVQEVPQHLLSAKIDQIKCTSWEIKITLEYRPDEYQTKKVKKFEKCDSAVDWDSMEQMDITDFI